jgi:uncharacterized protein YaaW (UPF0174 family)
MEHESIEAGGLLAVLQRANHHELCAIVEAVDKALDSVIKWDARYEVFRNDLTKVPVFVAEHLCRAGGHSVRNWFRGGGPSYCDVVRDVCGTVGVMLPDAKAGVVEMETAFLKVLIERAFKGLSPEEQAALLKKIAETAGRPINYADLISGGAMFSLLAAVILEAVIGQAAVKGLAGAAAARVAFGRIVGGVAGPIGFFAGAAWLVYDIAGPSLRGTIPAVAQVALLRQRFLWADA